MTPAVVEGLRAALLLSAAVAEVDVERLTLVDPMWAPVEVRIGVRDVAPL